MEGFLESSIFPFPITSSLWAKRVTTGKGRGGRIPGSKEHDQSLIQMKSAIQTHEAVKAEANTK